MCRLSACVSAGDYDGALAVLTEMQYMCQERGLHLPGTNTPVGKATRTRLHYIMTSLPVKQPTCSVTDTENIERMT